MNSNDQPEKLANPKRTTSSSEFQSSEFQSSKFPETSIVCEKHAVWYCRICREAEKDLERGIIRG